MNNALSSIWVYYIIDSKLTWKHHVSKISKTVSRSLGIMYKLRPFLPLQIMRNVYYSLIYSHLVYGIKVWGSACKTELNKLLVYRKELRLMTYNDQYPVIPGPLSPSNPIFVKLELLKIEEIFKYYISKFIFKCLLQLTPINFHNWFKTSSAIHNYNIEFNSDSKNLFIPPARTTSYGLKQITVSGPKIWNDLPYRIKTNISLNIFLKNLKAHLLSNY